MCLLFMSLLILYVCACHIQYSSVVLCLGGRDTRPPGPREPDLSLECVRARSASVCEQGLLSTVCVCVCVCGFLVHLRKADSRRCCASACRAGPGGAMPQCRQVADCELHRGMLRMPRCGRLAKSAAWQAASEVPDSAPTREVPESAATLRVTCPSSRLRMHACTGNSATSPSPASRPNRETHEPL